MNNGWIKLHRSILDWEWYDDVNARMLFIHCLLKANCKDVKYRGVVVKRGSFLTSVEILSSETNLTTSQIRSSLNNLKKTSDLTNETSSKGSVISITNYDSYQSNDKPISNEIANELTNESQTDDKPIATNKNIRSVKNEKNEEKDTIVSKKKVDPKKSFGEEGGVKLTQEEYDRLVKDYGQKAVEEKIFSLEGWLNKGNKSKSDNLTIRNWFRREGGVEKPENQPVLREVVNE